MKNLNLMKIILTLSMTLSIVSPYTVQAAGENNQTTEETETVEDTAVQDQENIEDDQITEEDTAVQDEESTEENEVVEYSQTTEIEVSAKSTETKEDPVEDQQEENQLVSAPVSADFPDVEIPYSDVKTTHWAYKYVQYGVANSLFTDIVDGTEFKGTQPITRVEAAVMMWNLAGRVSPARNYEDIYPDVQAADYDNDVLNAIEWCYESGIMTGKKTGYFAPSENIKRKDFAVIMYRYANYIGVDTRYKVSSLDQYKDANLVSSYAQDAVKWCGAFPYTYDSKMLSGLNETTMDPNGNITRYQATKITAVMKQNAQYVESYSDVAKYNIVFNSNGGKGTMNSLVGVANRSYTISSNKFTRVGYEFVNWNTKADGSGSSYNAGDQFRLDDTFSDGQSITLYAQWKITATVTYNSNYKGGASSITENITDNWKVKANNTFSRSNYFIQSWNTKADGTGKSYAFNSTQKICNSLTLYAIWEKVVDANAPKGCCDNIECKSASTVHVTGWAFDADYPSKPLTIQVYADSTLISTFTANQKSDDVNAVYSSDKISGKHRFDQTISVTICGTQKISVYALDYYSGKQTFIDSRYVTVPSSDPDAVSYTVILNPNNGSNKQAISLTYYQGVEYTLQQNTFTKAQSTFIGWNTKKDGNGTTYKDLAKFKQTDVKAGTVINLYAQWKKNTGKVSDLKIDSANWIAHRGYSAVAPDNTIASFTLAGKAGFWGCETDVWITKDGQFVCMHDYYIYDNTGKSGVVKDYTLAQMQAMTITSGNNVSTYKNEKVPSLQQYLNICKEYEMVPVIEIKGGSVTGGAVLTNEQLKTLYDIVIGIMGNREVYFIAFDLNHVINLSNIIKNSSNVHLQYLTFNPNTCDYKTLKEYNIAIGAEYSSITNSTVPDYMELSAWTCNEEEDAKKLINNKSIVNITTNHAFWLEKK